MILVINGPVFDTRFPAHEISTVKRQRAAFESAGIVDMADYNLWKANFGAPGSRSAIAAAPEPNTMLLLSLAVFSRLRIRRR